MQGEMTQEFADDEEPQTAEDIIQEDRVRHRIWFYKLEQRCVCGAASED